LLAVRIRFIHTPRAEGVSQANTRLSRGYSQLMGLQPQRASRTDRINACVAPPRSFIAAAVNFAMVLAAKWHRELVADLAAKRTTLREAQVMGVRRPSITNQTGLLGHVSNVIPIANPVRLGEGKNTLIDAFNAAPLG
jgi:hypothetical protein